MKTAPTVTLFTDGSCAPNPGVGGWSAVLQFPSYGRIMYGGFQYTSSNRMETYALIKALESLDRPHKVILYSDSRYLTQAINENKIKHWIKINQRGKNVANIDLWQQIHGFAKIHTIQAYWIPRKNNKLADRFARYMTKKVDQALLEVDTGYFECLKSKRESTNKNVCLTTY